MLDFILENRKVAWRMRFRGRFRLLFERSRVALMSILLLGAIDAYGINKLLVSWWWKTYNSLHCSDSTLTHPPTHSPIHSLTHAHSLTKRVKLNAKGIITWRQTILDSISKITRKKGCKDLGRTCHAVTVVRDSQSHRKHYTKAAGRNSDISDNLSEIVFVLSLI